MKNAKVLFSAILCLVAFCAIAVVFKVFPLAELPASFIGAALGAVITGVVTVVLLQGQSKAEELKERNVKVFQEKAEAFKAYIKEVWKIWENHEVDQDEFKILTSMYYRDLMIYLDDEKIFEYETKKYVPSVLIAGCITEIGRCLARTDGATFEILRKNIVLIINVLSDQIGLGGQIDEKIIKEHDAQMLPIIFKNDLLNALNSKFAQLDLGLEKAVIDPNGYGRGTEHWMFKTKYPKTQIVIGPLNPAEPGKLCMGLDISRDFHQFDEFRVDLKYKKKSYWINTINPVTKKNIFLNDSLPNDVIEEEKNEESTDKYLCDNSSIPPFSIADIESLKAFDSKKIALLASRAVSFIEDVKVINDGKTISELLHEGFANGNK